MASVQIRTKRGEYYAFFQDRSGNRTCRNTGTKNKREAQRIANLWEQEASKEQCLSTPAPAPTDNPPTAKIAGFKDQTRTGSSRHKALRVYIQREPDAKSPDFADIPQADPALVDASTPPADIGPVAAEWIKFLEHRIPMLERQVRDLAEFDEHEDQMAVSFSEIDWPAPPEILQSRHVPTPEEHAATLKTAWQEVISGREKAAWGKMTLTPAGHIETILVDGLALHAEIPTAPTPGPGEELVLVIRDPRSPEAEYQCENHSGMSAEKRIQSGRLDLALPEYSAWLLDKPFETLEQFQLEIDRMIDLQGGEGTLSQAQRWRIRDFHDNAANCLKRAYALLTNEPLNPLVRATAWMSLTSQFISATNVYAEARRTLSDEQERRARANMKLDDQKSKGRGKDNTRGRLIQILADHRRAGLSRSETLDRMVADGHLKFNRRKNSAMVAPTLFWIKSGQGWSRPKSIKTLEKYWTEATKKPAK